MTMRQNLADWVLRAAAIIGFAYTAHQGLGLDPSALVIWKGAGVALLACWAALIAHRVDGWLLAALLACGAAGDVLLETAGLMIGALAFALGHLVAIWLYSRNRRPLLSRSQRWFALLLVPLVVISAWSLPLDRSQAAPIAFYALLLSSMAAMAWTSRFSRFRVGIGAMMFVASDLLIFARLGPIGDTVSIGVAVWLLYFAGQYLIATGVGRTLQGDALLRSAGTGP